MYKVGKVFMEDSEIIINDAGHRVVICPICEDEIRVEDDETAGDTILCGLCDTLIKLVE